MVGNDIKIKTIILKGFIMNKNNFFKNTLFIISLSLITFITVSCASTKKVIEQPAYEDGLYDETPDENNEELSTESTAPAMTDTFLGEFNPILLKETICLLKSGKKMRPKELAKTYLIPTSNKVEVHFRDLTNQVCIILDKQERDQIVEAANKFLEQYESKTLHRGKVNRKTAYFTSKAGVYFGLTGYGNGTDKCDYYANSEIFDKHAYFLLNLRIN